MSREIDWIEWANYVGSFVGFFKGNVSANTVIKVQIKWRSCSSKRVWTWPLSISRTVGAIRHLENSKVLTGA
jgi:hypothetical protein